MLSVLLLAAMVVLNSTADVKVPLQVTVGGQQQGGGSTTPALDVTTIGGIVSLAGAVAYRWKKSNKHEDKFDDRTTTSTQTVMQTAESLKQTDTGIVDTLASITKAISLIPGIPPEATKLVTDQLEAWKKDNEAYYVNTPAKPTDLSADPIVRKLGEVQKITEKNG